MDNKTFFDKWSKSYDKFILKKLLWYWQDKAINELDSNDKRILDVSCGTGKALEKIAGKYPKAKLTGIDLSKGMKKQAEKRLKGKNAEILLGKAEKLPFKNNSFDAVISTESLHHYTNGKQAIKEMARVGKKIIIVDINIPPLFLTRILFKLEPGFTHMYGKEEMKKMFENAGIRVAKQERVGLFAILTIGKTFKYKQGT